jgi:outer membrane protein insertion porin family
MRIVGNRAFSEGTLKGLFDLDTGGWLSWYTKSDRYSRTKLNADLEALRSYYLQRGFLEFRIDSTQVAISPNKQDISVTVNVTEGERYVVSGVRLEGDYLGKEDEFKSLVKIKPGEPYNADQVTETTKAFTDYFGNFGYAFAQVEARPEIDRVQQPRVLRAGGRALAPRLRAPHQRGGQQPHARRSDPPRVPPVRVELVRRRQDQAVARPRRPPGLLQGRERRDQRRARRARPGRPERQRGGAPTGSLQLGAGFSSAEKLALSFSIKQENAFGTGNYLGVEVNTSKYNRTLAFTTVNPYFTPDGISRTIDLYHRSSRPYDDQGGNYQLVTRARACASACRSASSTRCSSAPAWSAPRSSPAPTSRRPTWRTRAVRLHQHSLPLSIGWARDDRDSTLAPTSGRYQRLAGEWGVAGDARYCAATTSTSSSRPLNKQYTFAFNGELGYGKGLNGQPFPVFKNFYSGGLGSVRGFEQGTLGPRDVTGASIGGPKKHPERRGDDAVPGRGQRPHAAHVRLRRRRQRVRREREVLHSATCAPRPASACPGCRRSARCASRSPSRCAKQPGDRIQKLQFQIGTSF